MALVVSSGSGTLADPYILDQFWNVTSEDVSSYVSGLDQFTEFVYFKFDTLPEGTGASGVGFWTIAIDSSPDSYDINLISRSGTSAFTGGDFGTGDESNTARTYVQRNQPGVGDPTITFGLANYTASNQRAGKTSSLTITPPEGYTPPISELALSGGSITAASSSIGTSGAVALAHPLVLAGGSPVSAASSSIDTSGSIGVRDPPNLALAGGSITAASSAVDTSGTVTLAVVPLVLSEWTLPELHELVASALIDATVDAGFGNLWIHANSFGNNAEQGELLDGDLDLDGQGYDVRAIRWNTDENINLFQINDNPDAADIRTFFASGGAGHDMTIHIMDKERRPASFDVADVTVHSTSNAHRWRVDAPDAFDTIMARIETGDRFILAFTELVNLLELTGTGAITAASSSISTSGAPTLTNPVDLALSGGSITAASSSIGTSGRPIQGELRLTGGSITAASSAVNTSGAVTLTNPDDLVLTGGSITAASSSISASGSANLVDVLELSGGSITATSSSINTSGALIFQDPLALERDPRPRFGIRSARGSIDTSGAVTLTNPVDLALTGGSITAASSSISSSGAVTLTGVSDLVLSGGSITAASSSISTSGTTTLTSPIPPGQTAAPVVRGSSQGSLFVNWSPPASVGSGVSGYNVRFRLSGASAWTTRNDVSRPYTIHGLLDSTTYEAQVQAFNQYGGDGPWSPTGTGTTIQEPDFKLGNYKLEADWDRDGQYNHSMSDLFEYMVRTKITTKRGRSYGSQIFGRSVAGGMTLTLRNEGNEFDRFNTQSPLYNYTIIGTPVRLMMEDVDNDGVFRHLWSGSIDRMNFKQRRGGQDEVVFICKDIIVELQETEASAPARSGVTCENATRILLNAGGISGEKIGEIKGDFIMEHWWSERQSLLRSIRELEETEGGFFWIDERNRVNFDDSTKRHTLAARTAKLMITDGS